MRVTNQSLSTQVQDMLQQALRRLNDTQEQITSGKRINRLADDPFGAVRSLDVQSLAASLDQYKKNIDGGVSALNQTDSTLGDVGDVLTRAKEIAVAMANGSMSAADRASAASEVHELSARLLSLGNFRFDNRYLFGGFSNGTAPFTAAVGGATYNGDSGAIAIQANRSTRVAINVAGDGVFQGVGVAGGVDLFNTLSDLETALSANDVSGANGITAQIGRLDAGSNQIAAFRAQVGARIETLNTASQGLDTMQLKATQMRSEVEDVDTLKIYSDFARLQQAFQAALESSARVVQPSILDFIK
jgi:flagellar hook-associated protein 3 FlgL